MGLAAGPDAAGPSCEDRDDDGLLRHPRRGRYGGCPYGQGLLTAEYGKEGNFLGALMKTTKGLSQDFDSGPFAESNSEKQGRRDSTPNHRTDSRVGAVS